MRKAYNSYPEPTAEMLERAREIYETARAKLLKLSGASDESIVIAVNHNLTPKGEKGKC